MAEEVSPEERVRPVEVLKGSSTICGFCTALGECSVEAGGREGGGGGEGMLLLLLYCTDTVFFSTSISQVICGDMRDRRVQYLFFFYVSIKVTYVHLNGFNVTITSQPVTWSDLTSQSRHVKKLLACQIKITITGWDFGQDFVTMLSRSSHGPYRTPLLCMFLHRLCMFPHCLCMFFH